MAHRKIGLTLTLNSNVEADVGVGCSPTLGSSFSPATGMNAKNVATPTTTSRTAEILSSLPNDVQDVIRSLPHTDQEIAAYAIKSLQKGMEGAHTYSAANSAATTPVTSRASPKRSLSLGGGISVRSPKSPRISMDAPPARTTTDAPTFHIPLPSPSAASKLSLRSPGLPPLSPLRQARSVPALTVIPPPSPAYSSSSAEASPAPQASCPTSATLPQGTLTPASATNSSPASASASTPRSIGLPPLSPQPPTTPSSSSSGPSPRRAAASPSALRAVSGGVRKRDSPSPRLARTSRAFPKNLTSPRPAAASPRPAAPAPAPASASPPASSSSNASGGSTSSAAAAPSPRGRPCGQGADWRPKFECSCFRCYRFFWSRWDASSNSAAIDRAVTLYESHVGSLSSSPAAGRPKTPNPSPATDSGEVAPAPPSPPALLRAVTAAAAATAAPAADEEDDKVSRLSEWMVSARAASRQATPEASPSAASAMPPPPQWELTGEVSLCSLVGAGMEGGSSDGAFSNSGFFANVGAMGDDALEGDALEDEGLEGEGDEVAFGGLLAGEPSLSSLVGSELGQELDLDLGADFSLAGILEEGEVDLDAGPTPTSVGTWGPATSRSFYGGAGAGFGLAAEPSGIATDGGAPYDLAAEVSAGSLGSEPSGFSVHSVQSEPPRHRAAAAWEGAWAAASAGGAHMGGTWPGAASRGSSSLHPPSRPAVSFSTLDARAAPFVAPSPSRSTPSPRHHPGFPSPANSYASMASTPSPSLSSRLVAPHSSPPAAAPSPARSQQGSPPAALDVSVSSSGSGEGQPKRKAHRRGVASTAKARLRRHMRRRALLEQAQAVATEICGDEGAPSGIPGLGDDEGENDPLSTMSSRGAGAEAATGLPLEAMLGGSAAAALPSASVAAGAPAAVVPEGVASAWRGGEEGGGSSLGGAWGAGAAAAWGVGGSSGTWGAPGPVAVAAAAAAEPSFAPQTPPRVQRQGHNAWGVAAPRHHVAWN